MRKAESQKNQWIPYHVLVGRHRWVEYASKDRYNASQVPPEWHGWLHFITDHTGDELLLLKPMRYGAEHRENLSGEGEKYIYHSKGHSLNPDQRDWTRYQPWEPTKKTFLEVIFKSNRSWKRMDTQFLFPNNFLV